jgi:hypothetical protein
MKQQNRVDHLSDGVDTPHFTCGRVGNHRGNGSDDGRANEVTPSFFDLLPRPSAALVWRNAYSCNAWEPLPTAVERSPMLSRNCSKISFRVGIGPLPDHSDDKSRLYDSKFDAAKPGPLSVLSSAAHPQGVRCNDWLAGALPSTDQKISGPSLSQKISK